MSLPTTYQNAAEYFEEAVIFFQQYEYLYNFANTKILLNDTLHRIDAQGIDDIKSIHSTINLNDYVTKILNEIEKFTVEYEDVELQENNAEINVPLSLKKKHEIEYLVKEISNVCEEVDCNTVVDFGSGLGYLDQLLYERMKFNVLGLECNPQHYNGAKKRQMKYHMESIDKVKYLRHTVTSNSSEEIEKKLNEKFFNHKGFCVTGLHACADLTVDAINLFLKMADAKAMILMSCCYHKMTENEGNFHNFPASNLLKDIFRKYSSSDYVKVPFLRLAAQPPSPLENLEDLVFNLLSRAVLELYAQQRNLKITRKKRKAVKMKNLENNFEVYLENARNNGFSLTCSCLETNHCLCPKDFNKEEVSQLWRETAKKFFKQAAIFVFLQRLLQPVFENFILCDRIVYLNERGIKCKMKKIVDEKISPRCLALVAYK